MTDIKCLVLDVDGVLTDGRVIYGGSGEPVRAFHIHDGLAIEWFGRLIGDVVILTGKESQAVRSRAKELGVSHVIQGSRDKLADLNAFIEPKGVTLEQVAMIGDDLPDLPVLTRCGYPMSPADAVDEVRSVARFVTERRGGRGAVREAIEHLMREMGRWREVVATYDPEKPSA